VEHLSYQHCPGAIALPAERLVINLWFCCPVQFNAPGGSFLMIFRIFIATSITNALFAYELGSI